MPHIVCAVDIPLDVRIQGVICNFERFSQALLCICWLSLLVSSTRMDSEIFQIVFWSCLGLGFVSIAAVLTLMRMDPASDALLYANDPLKKSS